MSTKQGGKWPYPCQVVPSGLLLVFAKAEWGECQFLTNGGKKSFRNDRDACGQWASCGLFSLSLKQCENP